MKFLGTGQNRTTILEFTETETNTLDALIKSIEGATWVHQMENAILRELDLSLAFKAINVWVIHKMNLNVIEQYCAKFRRCLGEETTIPGEETTIQEIKT